MENHKNNFLFEKKNNHENNFLVQKKTHFQLIDIIKFFSEMNNIRSSMKCVIFFISQNYWLIKPSNDSLLFNPYFTNMDHYQTR